MGLPLTAPLSVQHDRPLVVARKRAYGLEGEVVVDQSTGYSKGAMYLNDVRPGERVLIVDDVLSTGGTLRAVIDGIRRAARKSHRWSSLSRKAPAWPICTVMTHPSTCLPSSRWMWWTGGSSRALRRAWLESRMA